MSSPLETSIAKVPPKSVSHSAFALLFSEIVQYAHLRVNSVDDLEKRLSKIGHDVGARHFEFHLLRDKNIKPKRETKTLFGHTGELQMLKEDEFMIVENENLVNRFISVPKDLTNLNCASFVAGIVRGILDAAEFPAKVEAYFLSKEEGSGGGAARNGIVITFNKEVLAREKRITGQQ